MDRRNRKFTSSGRLRGKPARHVLRAIGALAFAAVGPAAADMVNPATGAGCPSGTVEIGFVAGLLNCRIPDPVVGDLLLPVRSNVLYSISGATDVGIDLGPDPANPRAGGVAGTLTIEPGVVVFAASFSSSLIINRGSRIVAEGTPTQPIIFTSIENVTGQSTPDSTGQWNGIAVLGRAPINTCSDAGATPGTVACEAPAATGFGGRFGGGQADDSSGRLAYVQVRYAGEFVPLTSGRDAVIFGGVGSGTAIDHFQSHNSRVSGIAWLGGRTNHKYLVVTGAADNAFDFTLGYKGLIQHAIYLQQAIGQDAGIFAGAFSGMDRTPRDHARIANATLIGDNLRDPVVLSGGADFGLVNTIISAAAPHCLDIDGAQTIAPADPAIDEVGPPVFRSVLFGCQNAARDEFDVPLAQILPLITGNANLLPPLALTLSGTFRPGPFEAGAVASNPRSIFPDTGTFFDETSHVGAMRNAEDAWFARWACGLGPETDACTLAPRPRVNLFEAGFE